MYVFSGRLNKHIFELVFHKLAKGLNNWIRCHIRSVLSTVERRFSDYNLKLWDWEFHRGQINDDFVRRVMDGFILVMIKQFSKVFTYFWRTITNLLQFFLNLIPRFCAQNYEWNQTSDLWNYKVTFTWKLLF